MKTFQEFKKENTIMLIKGGWFGNQTPCYAGDGQKKTEKEWKQLYDNFMKGINSKEKEKKDWISFNEKLPKNGQCILLKQEEYTERAIFREDGTLEIILPQHKVMSIVTTPTHWKDDTF